jgi:eukaryotic-like serine/threonine-protein kinase
MNDILGKQIDHNRIDSLLVDGGMGAVYGAYALHLARKVALKLMHSSFAGQQEFKARFMQEANPRRA